MPRSLEFLIQDIVEAITRIQCYVNRLDVKTFKENTLIQDAVLRNLGIIGEAAKNMPSEFKQEHHDIEWQLIAGFRDILVHAYHRVDLDIIWDILVNEIPALKEKIT